jgi:hypothetical protein
MSPPASVGSSYYVDPTTPPIGHPSYGGYPHFTDERRAGPEGSEAAKGEVSVSSIRVQCRTDSWQDDDYKAPFPLTAAILRGVYNFADMPLEDIKPIVWVIANNQPRNNGDS